MTVDLITAITVLRDTQLPNILVVGGIIFLFLAVGGQFVPHIQIPPGRQMLAGIIGGLLLISGTLLYIIPVAIGPSIRTSTVVAAVTADIPTSTLILPSPTNTPTSQFSLDAYSSTPEVSQPSVVSAWDEMELWINNRAAPTIVGDGCIAVSVDRGILWASGPTEGNPGPHKGDTIVVSHPSDAVKRVTLDTWNHNNSSWTGRVSEIESGLYEFTSDKCGKPLRLRWVGAFWALP